MASKACVLCGSPDIRFEVQGHGRVISGGPHQDKEVKPGDLVCYTCMTTTMATAENGEFIVVNEHFHVV